MVWVRSLGVSRHELSELLAHQKTEKKYVNFLVNINGDHADDVNTLGLITYKHK